MRPKRLGFALGLLTFSSVIWAAELTREQGEALLRQFLPTYYREADAREAESCGWKELYHALRRIPLPWHETPPPLLFGDTVEEARKFLWGSTAAFLELRGPWEPQRRRVMLFYLVEWLLVESKDGGTTWELIQQSEDDIVPVGRWPGFYDGWLAQADVDLDGVAEVLLGWFGSPREGAEDLFIYAFRNGRLELISPVKRFPTEDCSYRSYLIESKLVSLYNRVALDDVDRDNVAEVVVMPGLRDWDESIDGSWAEYSGTESHGRGCRACVERDEPIRVYKLKDGRYELWKEIDRKEPFPFGHPALGVFHPGVVTYSQLKNGQGLGELRVFVSTPALGWVQRGPRRTVDDYDLTSFVVDFNGKPLKFRKKWENKRFPELGKGDQAVNGVWVYELGRKGCPPWEVNPAEVAYPHPDPCREYAFVGPYVEFSVRREDVAEFILRSAEKKFEEEARLKAQGAPLKGPERGVVFVQVDILGSMKNGKRVLVQALIGVKKDTSPQAPRAAGAAK